MQLREMLDSQMAQTLVCKVFVSLTCEPSISASIIPSTLNYKPTPGGLNSSGTSRAACAARTESGVGTTPLSVPRHSQAQSLTSREAQWAYNRVSTVYDNPLVHIIKQPEPQLTQFQHYKRLISMLWSEGILHTSNYAIFTDDDDIMSPVRNATYLEHTYDGLEVIRIADSVVRFSLDCDIQDHKASIQEALKKEGVIINYLNPSEYVDICIRGDILAQFMSEIDDEKAASYTCDCMFNSKTQEYIQNNPGNTRDIVAEKPLYYYRYSMFRTVRHKYLEEVNNSQD